MIYFDNAATSFPKPPSVIRTLTRTAKRFSGNPGRSSHKISLEAANIVYNCRERICELFSAPSPENVVFTYNATYALNIAIKSVARRGGHFIISDLEHNSVFRPLMALKESLDIDFSIFNSSADIEEEISKNIRPDTIGIISTLASNVTGARISLKKLSKAAKEHSLILITDASQIAGHEPIRLDDTPCDILCAPGHKGLLGVMGCGFAIFKENKRMQTIIEGGSGSDSLSPSMPSLLPEGYEAGTLSVPVIASLDAGIKRIEDMGINAIRDKEEYLGSLLRQGILEIKSSVLYPSYGAIACFNIANVPSTEVARGLNERGIAVRAGLHCAPLTHKKLGTLKIGTVRASLSAFNTKREIADFLSVLSKITKGK